MFGTRYMCGRWKEGGKQDQARLKTRVRRKAQKPLQGMSLAEHTLQYSWTVWRDGRESQTGKGSWEEIPKSFSW